MRRSALILAAHGSYDGSAANALVRRWADGMAGLGWFDEVAVAFHLGKPGFSTVLDSLVADDIAVIPIMTGEGYFCDTVLPRALATNTRYPQVRVRQTRPVGTHPDIKRVGRRRIADVLQRYGLRANHTALIIVGHGTERYVRSRAAVVGLADSCRRGGVCTEVTCAFLDEPPLLEDVFDRVTQPNAIIVPFLIGGGLHVIRDIPRRLGMNCPQYVSPPYGGCVGYRFVVFDIAVGAYREIPAVIADLAKPYARLRHENDKMEVAR